MREALEEGQVYRDNTGYLVKLDRRVAGDGTQWFVATWCNNHWSYDDGIIEPSDLQCKVADPEKE